MKEEPTNSKSIYNKTKLNKRLQFPYKLHVFNFSISECFDLQPKGSNGMLEKNGAHCHIYKTYILSPNHGSIYLRHAESCSVEALFGVTILFLINQL